MTTSSSPFIEQAKDAAQQMATACLFDDRSRAVAIAEEYERDCPAPMVLSLVLADLVCMVHTEWSKSLDFTVGQRSAAWAAFLADIEEWRVSS